MAARPNDVCFACFPGAQMVPKNSVTWSKNDSPTAAASCQEVLIGSFLPWRLRFAREMGVLQMGMVLYEWRLPK
jgi:hypothetical protein